MGIIINKDFCLSRKISAQKANAKMVTSVLAMMMMMTIFAPSLVEIVQADHQCNSAGWYCEGSDYCVYVNKQFVGCCPAGCPSYGTSGCCPSDREPYTVGGCCPKGYRAWQLDDGSMICCENGQTCPRTSTSATRELSDPVAASDGHSAFVPLSPLVSGSKLASSYEKMMKNEK